MILTFNVNMPQRSLYSQSNSKLQVTLFLSQERIKLELQT